MATAHLPALAKLKESGVFYEPAAAPAHASQWVLISITTLILAIII